MNLRALFLLLLFLLMQAGAAMAGGCKAAPPAHTCEHGCCAPASEVAGNELQSGCACLKSSPEGQQPETPPVIPAPSTRDHVSQTVWLQVVLADLWMSAPERGLDPPVAFCHPVSKAVVPVSLQVLHCAFLI